MLEKCFRREYEVKILCSRSCASPVTCRAVTKRIWGGRVGFWRNLPVGILLLTSRVPTFLAGFCPSSDSAHTETFDAVCVFVCLIYTLVWILLSSSPGEINKANFSRNTRLLIRLRDHPAVLRVWIWSQIFILSSEMQPVLVQNTLIFSILSSTWHFLLSTPLPFRLQIQLVIVKGLKNHKAREAQRFQRKKHGCCFQEMKRGHVSSALLWSSRFEGVLHQRW